jgi:hypothetical protein
MVADIDLPHPFQEEQANILLSSLKFPPKFSTNMACLTDKVRDGNLVSQHQTFLVG